MGYPCRLHYAWVHSHNLNDGDDYGIHGGGGGGGGQTLDGNACEEDHHDDMIYVHDGLKNAAKRN